MNAVRLACLAETKAEAIRVEVSVVAGIPVIFSSEE
jgi:hypothetical protein